MKDQATYDATPLTLDSAPAQSPGATMEPTFAPPSPAVVPGAAARWWNDHPAQLPQSTVLWNDEPAGTGDVASTSTEALSPAGSWGI